MVTALRSPQTLLLKPRPWHPTHDDQSALWGTPHQNFGDVDDNNPPVLARYHSVKAELATLQAYQSVYYKTRKRQIKRFGTPKHLVLPLPAFNDIKQLKHVAKQLLKQANELLLPKPQVVTGNTSPIAQPARPVGSLQIVPF